MYTAPRGLRLSADFQIRKAVVYHLKIFAPFVVHKLPFDNDFTTNTWPNHIRND